MANILTTVGGAIGRDIATLRVRRLQRKYNFEVLLPTVGWMLGELVAPFIQSISYSDYAITEAASIKKAAYQAFYVNDLAAPTLTMTFLDTEEGIVSLYLKYWRSLMVNSKGLWYNKSNYVRDIVLTYLTAEGLPMRSVKFRKAFPLVSYKTDLSYESNEVQKIEVPFVCDMLEQSTFGEGFVGAIAGPIISAFGNVSGI